jgi:hypothetical protein
MESQMADDGQSAARVLIEERLHIVTVEFCEGDLAQVPVDDVLLDLLRRCMAVEPFHLPAVLWGM